MVACGRLVALLLTLLVVLWPITGRTALTDLPAEEGLPVRVAPRLTVERVLDVNVKDNTFSSEVGLTLQWRDGRLAFDSIATGQDEKEYLNEAAKAQLARMWQPKVALLNQSEPPKSLSALLLVKSDGSVRYTERLLTKARIEWHLEDYPFDRQNLVWQWGSSDYSREAVVLRTGSVEMPSHLVIKNWDPERTIQATAELTGATGRRVTSLTSGIVVKRQPMVVITQVLMPFLAITLLPMIALFTVGPNTPTQLFTALLALLTLNFKIVLEEPAIVSVNNAVGDALSMGYAYIGITVVLALSVMKAVPENTLSDRMIAIRGYLKWWAALTFITLVGGRLLASG